VAAGRKRAQDVAVISDARAVGFVPSTDLARSRAFYAGVLGLPVVGEDSFALVVRLANLDVRITAVGGSYHVQPFTVLGWKVEDIHAEIRDLTERGVEFVDVDGIDQDEDGVWAAPGGTLVAWFQDPDGNTLSLDQN
jgi:catechol 2,3-dioxygenase-like lactoylglutathione lyase family enzyme